MENPDVSVVIPVYNAVPFLREAVESVLCQEGVRFEIILVDDGSSDGSLELSRTLESEIAAVRLLQHEGGLNKGVSRTRRLGIDAAKGEFIAFLDADDGFRPGKLKAQVELLRAQPSIVLAHTLIDGINERSEPIEDSTIDWLNDGGEPVGEYSYGDQPSFLIENHICNSSVLVRAADIAKIQWDFPQLFQYEDWLLWTLLSERGRFYKFDDHLTIYRVHKTSFTSKLVVNQLLQQYSRMEYLLVLHSRTSIEHTKRQINIHLDHILSRLEHEYSLSANDARRSARTFRSRIVSGRGQLSFYIGLVEKALRRLLRRK